MNAERRPLETLTCETLEAGGGVALVLSVPGVVPSTLPPTLAKALNGAVLTEGSLVLPLDSLQLKSTSGVVWTMSDLKTALLPLGGGSARLLPWSGSLRDLYAVLVGSRE